MRKVWPTAQFLPQNISGVLMSLGTEQRDYVQDKKQTNWSPGRKSYVFVPPLADSSTVQVHYNHVLLPLQPQDRYGVWMWPWPRP